MWPENNNAVSQSQFAATSGAGIQPAKPAGHLQKHADELAQIGAMFTQQNLRLAELINRVFGPAPEQKTQSSQQQLSPSGAVYVAQFAARQIGNEVERLRDLIARLEELV
jgi:hypothetical protein